MGRSKAKYELGHSHLERLVHYYHFLGERVDLDETTRVSSQQLAQLLTMDDTQVRKDLAAIGVRGVPRLGYRAAEVVEAIRQVLGFDQIHRAILVGAGRLGGALAAYRGFVKYGLRIVGVFDQDLGKVGTTIGGHFVYSTNELETVIERNNARLAILAVPAETCQASRTGWFEPHFGNLELRADDAYCSRRRGGAPRAHRCRAGGTGLSPSK